MTFERGHAKFELINDANR